MFVILMPDDFICQVLKGKVLGANGLISLLFIISSTFTVLQHQEELMRETEARENKAPDCRSCGHPMKGHKNVDCP